MLVAPVCPLLPTAHRSVAAVGAMVGELLVQPLKVRPGCVFTVRLTPMEAADPVLGVAVRVPLYVPAAVPVVTVTVPQALLASQVLFGPDTVAPVIVE